MPDESRRNARQTYYRLEGEVYEIPNPWGAGHYYEATIGVVERSWEMTDPELGERRQIEYMHEAQGQAGNPDVAAKRAVDRAFNLMMENRSRRRAAKAARRRGC